MMWLRRSDLGRRLRDGVPLILWMALIFWLSSRSTLVAIKNESVEKLAFNSAHAVAYAILAWLWWRAIRPRRQIDRAGLWGALGLTVLYGVSDEIHQLFVPGRSAQISDLLFDAGGAVAMLLLIRHVELLRTFPDRFLARPDVKSFPRRFRGGCSRFGEYLRGRQTLLGNRHNIDDTTDSRTKNL